MRGFTVAVTVAPLLALGCAGRPIRQPLPESHPASPAAATAPLPDYPDTLNVPADQNPAPQQPAAPATPPAGEGGSHEHH